MSEEEIGRIVWEKEFRTKMSAEQAGAVVFELWSRVPWHAKVAALEGKRKKLAAVQAKRKKPAQMQKSSKH